MTPPTSRLVIGTTNPGKVAELTMLLSGIDVVPRPEGMGDVEEDADTLEGNARLKSRAVCAASGDAAVADDTGLEVDALDGAPGVWSARFAGPDATDEQNIDLLLARMAGVAHPNRTARFRTVVVVTWPSGEELVVEGTCRGRITTERMGTSGFGYDPVFEPDERPGQTFATLELGDKNAISHRGRALASLRRSLGLDP